MNLSDSGEEALCASVGRSLAWPRLLKAHGTWSSRLLRGPVELQGLRAAACMAQGPFPVSFHCPALDPSYGSTYLGRSGCPSHTTGCGVGRHPSGAPSPSAWPLLATNAGRGPVTHCWLHPGIYHPVPGPGKGQGEWGQTNRVKVAWTNQTGHMHCLY